LAIALSFSLIPGCQASLNAEAIASSSGEASAHAEGSAEADGRGDLDTPVSSSAMASAADQPALASDLPPSRVLLGARHDLSLRPGKGTANCECLSVALGGARSNGMLWRTTPPNIDDSTQLTIALSSEGADCKGEPKGSLGASYWGYRIRGNDVVVLVEAARGGRPLTRGAVIPRPVASGQVFVAPASKKLPYGRPTDGKGLCKIGNPGQARTTAFTELELGTDAPPPGSKMRAESEWQSDPNDVPTTIEMPSN
jgi:hypothetical protein